MTRHSNKLIGASALSLMLMSGTAALAAVCSLDISGRQKLGKFENFLWSKFFAGLERPVRVMTWENGVIIRSGP